MIITQTSLAALFTAFKSSYQGAFDGVKPAWPELATEVPSTSETNSYDWLGSWPKLREWIGDRQVNNLTQSGYTVKNRKFESTVFVPASKIEDDQYGVYKPMMAEMGRAAAEFPDELVFALLKSGFTAKCYDGAAFFGNHKVGRSTLSNLQDGAKTPWYLMDCSRALKPLIYQPRRQPRFVTKDDPTKSDHVFMRDEYVYGVDTRANAGFGFWQMAYASKAELTRDNFRAAFAAMTALEDENGRKLNIRPTHLVVPTTLEFAARDIILASVNATGQSNTDMNLVKVLASPFVG